MRYVRPDESLLGAAVTGTVDADFLAAWLTDGAPAYPVQRTGNLSLTVTPAAAQLVDVVAVTHHNIRASATITLGGSLSSSIPTSAPQANGIPSNWARVLETPVSVSSLVLGVTGNVDPIVIGELFAGKSRTLPPLRLGRTLTPGEVFPWEGQIPIIPPYDYGGDPGLRITGNVVLTETQLNDVRAWHRSLRNGSLPTLIIPDYPTDEVWLAVFSYTSEDYVPALQTETHEALFMVQMEIVEIPRLRW